MSAAPLLAAVEGGGTKFVCAVGTGPGNIRARARIATRGPDETLAAVADFLASAAADHGPVAALGVGCFGPLDLHRASPTWGHLTATAKPGWTDVDICGPLGRALDCPVAFDTDVNAAALGEHRWGAGRGLDDFVYLTVGTGIGGGAIVRGRPVHGLAHPEMGHVPLRRHPDDPYPGRCPFHGDCAEGLASGPAISGRFGAPLDALPPDHPFRALLADYLGQLCAQVVLMYSPQRIVIGGGVMTAGGLHAPIRAAMRRRLAGFAAHPNLERDDFIVPPVLGDDAGVLGALALAMDA